MLVHPAARDLVSLRVPHRDGLRCSAGALVEEGAIHRCRPFVEAATGLHAIRRYEVAVVQLRAKGSNLGFSVQNRACCLYTSPQGICLL